jgi:hypothetical protein
MLEAGLQNIPSKWMSFDKEPTEAYIAKHGQEIPPETIKHVRDRSSCDRCYFHATIHGEDKDCHRAFESSDTCGSCHELGRPCSWTASSVLLGDALLQPRDAINVLGEFPWSAQSAAFRTALLHADNDMIREATKPVTLPLGMDLGFRTVKLSCEELSGDECGCE